MRDISMAEIRKFNVEQMSTFLLSILKRNLNGSYRTRYSPGSLTAILSFEIAPIWLGKYVKNGVLIQGGAVMSYADDSAPADLNSIFYQAVELLRQQNIIIQDETQQFPDFMKLTEKGKGTQYDDTSMSLVIERSVTMIRDWYAPSIFLVEVKKHGDTHQGTAFLSANNKIITCHHVIKDAAWEVYLDANTPFDSNYFEVKELESLDIAILKFKSDALREILKNKKPLQPVNEAAVSGAKVITFGYPKIAQRCPALCVDEGTLNATTESYSSDRKYLTFSNRIDGGCSGGPVVNQMGWLMGIITEVTINSAESSTLSAPQNSYGHAIPIEVIKMYLDC